MTAQEALDLANAVLNVAGDEPLPVPAQAGSERQQVEAVLRAYAARLRAKRPELSAINDDLLLPDIVVQRIAEALRAGR